MVTKIKDNINNYLKNVTETNKKIIDTGFIKDTVNNNALKILLQKVYNIPNYYKLFDVNICKKFLDKFGFISDTSYRCIDSWLEDIVRKLGTNYFSENIQKNDYFINNIFKFNSLLELLEAIIIIVNNDNKVPKVIRIKIIRVIKNINDFPNVFIGGNSKIDIKILEKELRNKLQKNTELIKKYKEDIREYSKRVEKLNPHLSSNLTNLIDRFEKIEDKIMKRKEEYIYAKLYYAISGDNYKYPAKNNYFKEDNIVNIKEVYENLVMKENIKSIDELEEYN